MTGALQMARVGILRKRQPFINRAGLSNHTCLSEIIPVPVVAGCVICHTGARCQQYGCLLAIIRVPEIKMTGGCQQLLRFPSATRRGDRRE